jgi:AcrR family transcriptional regulator
MSPVTTFQHPRATRAAGQQTRRALLDAAGPLFAERGLAGVSQADIAAAAGTFPSQVTYYFGSKEALFVEAACRGVLRAATVVEQAGARTRTPRTYVRAMVHTALAN